MSKVNPTALVRNITKLPEVCYHISGVSGEIVRLYRGVQGYQETDIPFSDMTDAQAQAEALNEELGVTKAQAEAMYCGSLFGFHVPAADPDNYDENGMFKQSKL